MHYRYDDVMCLDVSCDIVFTQWVCGCVARIPLKYRMSLGDVVCDCHHGPVIILLLSFREAVASFKAFLLAAGESEMMLSLDDLNVWSQLQQHACENGARVVTQ